MEKESFFEKALRFTFETAKLAIIALAIVIPFRMFIAQPFIVNGASMVPTFESGDYLIVDQISLNFEEIERGDVIIFKYPTNNKRYLIKRVIGLPEDKITIKDGNITIEDKDGHIFKIEESYIKFKKEDSMKITIDKDEYFVMGDNRAQSSDSRSWGPLKADLIIGRPVARLLPFKKMSLFPGRFEQSLIEEN